jgi:hypothetical protein
MKFLMVVAGLIAMSICSPQTPSLEGRWQVEFNLSDSRTHLLRFDAQGSGVGTFLLLDATSNLIPPAEAKPATWRIEGSEVTFSGEIEFPIGNVGRDPGVLTFRGLFDSSTSIKGDVTFVSSLPAGIRKTGTFTAKLEVPGLSVNLRAQPAKKLRRGQDVRIDWEVKSQLQIVSQELFVSIDNGLNFAPISPVLEGDLRGYTWSIPKSMPKAKKALIKILVTDESGSSSFDVTDQTFKIK